MHHVNKINVEMLLLQAGPTCFVGILCSVTVSSHLHRLVHLIQDTAKQQCRASLTCFAAHVRTKQNTDVLFIDPFVSPVSTDAIHVAAVKDVLCISKIAMTCSETGRDTRF